MLHRKIQGNEGNISTETDMAKTGRPPLEPRIAALEARMAEMEKREAIAAESMRTARLADVPRETYKPLYEQWPGNGS